LDAYRKLQKFKNKNHFISEEISLKNIKGVRKFKPRGDVHFESQ